MGGDILVVEDDTDIRSFLTECLTLFAYTVRTATNGREALDILADRRPDLIMLDVLMPVMSGLAFLKHREAEPMLRAIPVLVMTASMNVRDVPLTADAVIPKPFDLGQLREQLQRLMPIRVT